ncbi:hypothetical protein SAMN04488101_101492 [Pedobacter nyackensis]|uniref:Uncharacterized protein n=1 Tax=Pedobacter nyackensis TaxID=475255 RepID=A0A1W2ADF2_9SPHI|nr:hypothetical protein SAMN04488101_101492 [Pedobacter nyackensis]
MNHKKLARAGLLFYFISMLIFLTLPKELRENTYIWLPYSLICVVWAYLIVRKEKSTNPIK